MHLASDRHEELVTAIYDERYAADYPALYIAPWPRKHERNVVTLNRILTACDRGSSWCSDTATSFADG